MLAGIVFTKMKFLESDKMPRDFREAMKILEPFLVPIHTPNVC